MTSLSMIRKVNKISRKFIKEELIFSLKRFIEKRLIRHSQQSDQGTVINYDTSLYT